MKIEIVLNHKQYQPEIEGLRSLPEGYTITVERSDGIGLTTLEVLTALQTCISGLENSVKVKNQLIGFTSSLGDAT